MKYVSLKVVSIGSVMAAVACGGEEKPPEVPPAPAPTVQSVASQPAVPSTPPQAVEPSPEEKRKAEDAKALAADRAAWEEKHKAEVARFTPEIRAEGKALAEKKFANGKAAITAALGGKHRAAGNRERDRARHPVETLEFFGFKPTMTVLDIGPGEGWYTELLAPALAKQGKYIATNNDPNGPADSRGTFYGQRFKGFLDTAPEIYGRAETVVIDGKAPKLPLDGQVDLALVMRGLHGMKNNGTLGTWLGEIHRALKPNGVLGIEEHRAPADADPTESSKKGYLPEKWVISEIEAAGFKLAGKSEVNANPKDTKDYPDGVWTLPPTLRKGDVDRDKYVAIGESDRMTLKFMKAAEKKAAPAPAKPNGAGKK